MSRPRDIVMNFQEKLKEAAAVIPNYKQLCSPAENLQPFRGKGEVSRAKRVKDIVDESHRVIEESLPPLNTTVVNFCQNCTCAQCSHHSSTFESDGALNATIMTIVQSYEAFLEMQRQQFMVMIRQLSQVAGLSVSMEGKAMHQSCAVVQTNSAANKMEAIECDSSVKTMRNDRETVTSENYLTESSLQDQVFRSPTPTVHGECEDDCSSFCSLPVKDKNQPLSLGTNVNFNQNVNEKKDKFTDIQSYEPFNNSYAESSELVRKMLSEKCRDCSVVLHRINVSNEKPVRNNSPDSQKLVPFTIQEQCSTLEFQKLQNEGHSLTNTSLQTVELPGNVISGTHDKQRKKKIIEDLGTKLDCKAPKQVATEANNSILGKPSTTRSGRTVQNPGQFWIKSTSQKQTNVLSGVRGQQVAAKKRGRPRKHSKNKSEVLTQINKVSFPSKKQDAASLRGKRKDGNNLQFDQPVLGSESKPERRKKRKSASSALENGIKSVSIQRNHLKMNMAVEAQPNNCPKNSQRRISCDTSDPDFVCYFEEDSNDTWNSSWCNRNLLSLT